MAMQAAHLCHPLCWSADKQGYEVNCFPPDTAHHLSCRRKVLKPPGAKAAGRPRGPGRPPATAEVRAARKAARAEKAEKGASEPQAARTLRKSTVQRAEEAEIGRQLREEVG